MHNSHKKRKFSFFVAVGAIFFHRPLARQIDVHENALTAQDTSVDQEPVQTNYACTDEL